MSLARLAHHISHLTSCTASPSLYLSLPFNIVRKPVTTPNSIIGRPACRAGLGKPGRRCVQLLPHHRLLCQICSGQVHRCQDWFGRAGYSCPSGHYPAVPDPCLQCHAHERSGCHCHRWGAASARLWQRCIPLLGMSTFQRMPLLETLYFNFVVFKC